jgi:uncharacterized protein (DUF2236 family)
MPAMNEREQDEERYRALRAELIASAAGPVEGLFGPKSGAWRILRELAIAFGGGRALLLQLAHPAVSSAVRQHSAYRQDLLGRTLRTFDAVYRIVFADLDSALAIADRVHARHRTVRGTIDSGPPGVPYRALDPELLFWVQATLIDTTFEVYELLVRRLDPVERETFFSEAMCFSAAFGIPRSVLPKTYADFKRYMADMLEGPTLRVGDTERAMREHLIAAANMPHFLTGLMMADDPRPASLLFALPGLGRATRAMFELATAAMLPERLTNGFGLEYGRRQKLEMAGVVRTLRSTVAVTPPAIRYVPIYHEAAARLAAAEGKRPPLHGVAHRWLWSLARAGASRFPVANKSPA